VETGGWKSQGRVTGVRNTVTCPGSLHYGQGPLSRPECRSRRLPTCGTSACRRRRVFSWSRRSGGGLGVRQRPIQLLRGTGWRSGSQNIYHRPGRCPKIYSSEPAPARQIVRDHLDGGGWHRAPRGGNSAHRRHQHNLKTSIVKISISERLYVTLGMFENWRRLRDLDVTCYPERCGGSAHVAQVKCHINCPGKMSH